MPAASSSPGGRTNDRIRKAYAKARAAPHEPSARLRLAKALSRTPRLDLARRHARRALAAAPQDWSHAQALGVLLFKLGALPSALRVLTAAARHQTMSARALRILAALFYRANERSKARKCMAAAAFMEPVAAPRHLHPERPLLLRLRSMEKGRFGIDGNPKTGLRQAKLKGGHFSVKDLIDDDRVNCYTASVFGDNLLHAEGLPSFDVIVNCISCPDLDPGGLERAETFLATLPDIPVINPPGKVRRTTRGENARRLGALPDVIFPQTELFTAGGPPEAVAAQIGQAGFAFPLIMRRRGTQTGQTVEKIESPQALRTWLGALRPGTPVYAISYIDCRGADGYFHKTRAFFIGGQFYPVANLSSDSWQIHSGDRYRIMSTTPQTQAEERRYLRDPEAYLGPCAFRALHRIRDVIGLDFFGIDFTLAPDGQVVVFEANAAMRHNFDHAGNFPYTRPYLERISTAFADMVDRKAAQGRASRIGALAKSA